MLKDRHRLVRGDMNRTCRTHVGSGSSWMWSIRTSCLMQKRHRCCRDLTLLNLETGYRSWTGVGGRPEPDTSQKKLYSYSKQRERDRQVEAERWRQTVRGVSVGYQGLWIAGSRGTFRSWSAWWLSLWTRPPSDNDPQTSDDTRDWTSLQRTDRNISCWLCSSIKNMNNWVRNCLTVWLKKSKTQKTCRHESEWETTTPRVHFTVRQPITELHIYGELKLKITLHQLIHFRPTIFHGYSSSGLWVM